MKVEALEQELKLNGLRIFTRSHSRKPTHFSRGMNANVWQFDRRQVYKLDTT